MCYSPFRRGASAVDEASGAPLTPPDENARVAVAPAEPAATAARGDVTTPKVIGLLTAVRDSVVLTGQRTCADADTRVSTGPERTGRGNTSGDRGEATVPGHGTRRPYQPKNGSIDFVEEIPTRSSLALAA